MPSRGARIEEPCEFIANPWHSDAAYERQSDQSRLGSWPHGGRGEARVACLMHNGPNAWRIRRVIEAMSMRMSERLPIGELARIAGLSPFHFSRQFKIETGLTPNRYLVCLRIERAKLLLVANPEWSLAQIAAFVGYRSIGQFSGLFRRETGWSPGAFRQGAPAPSLGDWHHAGAFPTLP